MTADWPLGVEEKAMAMARVLLENVPRELSERLSRSAEAHARSVSEEAVRLIARAIEDEDARARHMAALEEIRRNRIVPPPGTPDAVEMLREDRAR